jgi:hypothetical protein
MTTILRSRPASTVALACTVLLAGAPFVAAASAGPASKSTFAGHWGGHGRSLDITKSGTAHESINDGCCDHLIDIYFKLRSPSGTTASAKIQATITRVKVSDSSAYPDPPKKGQKTQFRLRDGVITEPLTKMTYCNAKQGLAGTCGA